MVIDSKLLDSLSAQAKASPRLRQVAFVGLHRGGFRAV